MARAHDGLRLNGLGHDGCCTLCGQLDPSPPGVQPEAELAELLLERPQLSRGVLGFALSQTAFKDRRKCDELAIQFQLTVQTGQPAKIVRCNLVGVLADILARQEKVRCILCIQQAAYSAAGLVEKRASKGSQGKGPQGRTGGHFLRILALTPTALDPRCARDPGRRTPTMTSSTSWHAITFTCRGCLKRTGLAGPAATWLATCRSALQLC
jgi:hypothetical protein